MSNLDNMYKFLEIHKLSNLIQGETDNMNSPILLNQLTSPSPPQKNSKPNGFTDEFYQIFKKSNNGNSTQILTEN